MRTSDRRAEPIAPSRITGKRIPRRSRSSASSATSSPHTPVIGESWRSFAARRLSISAPRHARHTISSISAVNT